MASSTRTTQEAFYSTTSQYTLQATVRAEIRALKNEIRPGVKITAAQFNSLKNRIERFVAHTHLYTDYTEIGTFGNTGITSFTSRNATTSAPSSIPGTKSSGSKITASDTNKYIQSTNYYIRHSHVITDN